MAVGDSLDWLPTGWTKHVKICNSRRILTYIEPLTNRKFYSKPEVLRFLKCGGSGSKTNDTEDDVDVDDDDDDLHALQKLEDSQCNENEKPEWLPRGWTMVLKPPRTSLLSSKKHKFIIDPVTGWKFFATPTVISYLSDNHDHSKSEVEKGADGSKTDIMPLKSRSSENLKRKEDNNFSPETENGNKNVYVERKTLDGLPPGWIKEIKVTRNSRGVRKDPYYTDPVTGYVFRSKKDSLRFLETGDIYQCAMLPRKRDELKWLTEETWVDEGGDINYPKLKNSPNQGTKPRKTFPSEQIEKLLDNDSREEKIVVVQGTPNNLPPGWIKEVKIQRKENGIIRRDPYYTDPASGYVFRSENDALRYLRTGDFSFCSIKPKKRDEMEWLKGDTTPITPTTNICKSSNQTKKRGLFPDLPSRSSKRLSALKLKFGESVEPVVPPNTDKSNLEEEDAATEDSLMNQHGSVKSGDEVECESDPVEDVCSDPCIDFAYKTLTGSISMENDSTVRSILQGASTSNLLMNGVPKRPRTGTNPTTDSSLQGGKQEEVP